MEKDTILCYEKYFYDKEDFKIWQKNFKGVIVDKEEKKNIYDEFFAIFVRYTFELAI